MIGKLVIQIGVAFFKATVLFIAALIVMGFLLDGADRQAAMQEKQDMEWAKGQMLKAPAIWKQRPGTQDCEIRKTRTVCTSTQRGVLQYAIYE